MPVPKERYPGDPPWLLPKGGTEPEREELVIRGPFPGADFHMDPWFTQDPSVGADAVNIDNLFGDLQTRPGLDHLLEFVEIGTSGVVNNRPLGNDKSLMFVDVTFATSPTDTDGVLYGKKKQGLADVVAVGKWYQRDAQSAERFVSPTLISWSHQRYKVVYLGGLYDFINLGQIVPNIAPNKPAVDLRIIGGYIRDCSQGYNTMAKIVRVSPGGTLTVAGGWPGPNTVGSEYAIFLPISDVDEDHIAGPSYFMGSDFCIIESYEGSARLSGSVNDGGFSPPVNPGANAEFTQLSLFEVDIPGLVPGMVFRFLSDPIDQTRGVVWIGPPTTNGPFGEDTREVRLWPPYTLPIPSPSSYEILQKVRYWVTGAAGSTIVSPGATPVAGQFLDDPQNDRSYVANSCMQFADRILIATDMSYGSRLNALAPSSEGPNMTGATFRDTFYHPGALMCSSTLDFRRFQGPSSAPYQLDIGPINWLFTLRDVGFAISANGIVAMTRTGIAADPLQFHKLMITKEFVPWAKPVVVDGTFAVILATDDICLFDGSQLKPITGKLAELYRNLISTGRPQQLPTHVFYEQRRGRVYVSRGTTANQADTMMGAPGGDLTMVWGTDDGQAFLNRFTNFIGGHAKWSNDIIDPIGRRTLDTEAMIHTTGRTKDVGGSIDRIWALRWLQETDENLPGVQSQILFNWTSPWFDFDGARYNKEVSRVRINFVHRGPFPQVFNLKVIQDDGTTCTGTFDLASTTPVLGAENVVFFTGSVASQLVMTGFAFKLQISSEALAPAPFFRPIIQEIGLTWEKKMEVAPL